LLTRLLRKTGRRLRHRPEVPTFAANAMGREGLGLLLIVLGVGLLLNA
jgi:hypothetical protein